MVSPEPERILGHLAAERGGPTVIVMSGLHGNEPTGVKAGRRVLDALHPTGVHCGDLIVVAGNLRALSRNVRFIDRDLNRVWTRETVSAMLRDPRANRVAEAEEQRDVLRTLQAVTQAARGPIYFLDLHTSSAAGPPFVTVGDTLRNRRFARQFPLPLILGLEEQVDGALLEYLNNFGFVTMGVEAGHHEAESSIDRHEAVLWMALGALGMVDSGTHPEVRKSRELLAAAARGTPQIVEVRHRHAITPADGFRMQAGFANFQAVQKGQVMATDRRGAVTAPEDGLVLLPLYQGKGDDGFFTAREVRPIWLGVSTVLRRLRVASTLPLLPGVSRHPSRAEVFLVDTRVARWFPLEVFHLFGFRKLRQIGDVLMVSRRRYDLSPPARLLLDPHEECEQLG